ncbi:MAG: HEAT repeat domain-containing protein [Kiritimatiellae bacterium]|nr:HEAT repeat domain-containing protein [Kiritimatiellia bacterium]MCO5062740.1 HEAT repeat domain-containing protein [Kiritimatiellia bacterium]
MRRVAVWAFLCVASLGARAVSAASPDYDALLYRALRYGNTEERREQKEDARQALFAVGADALREVMARAHYENVMLQVFAFELVSGHVPAEAGVPVLAEFLNSEHEQTRRVAAYLLGFYPRAEDQVPALMGMLSEEKLRGVALRTLGKWKVDAVRPVARELLRDESERIRIAACNALGAFADPADLSALIEAMGDGALLVRNGATRAVLQCGAAARAVLEATLPESEGTKRRQIEQALRVLKGEWEGELPYY